MGENQGITRQTFMPIYFTWAILFASLWSAIVILIIYRLIFEYKKYIDRFRIIQYVILLIIFCSAVLFLSGEIIYPPLIPFFGKIYKVTLLNVLNFQFANLSCWFIMIFHLKKYQDLTDGSKYKDVQKSIRSTEKLVLILLITCISVPNIIWVYFALVELIHRWTKAGEDEFYSINTQIWKFNAFISGDLFFYYLIGVELLLIILSIVTLVSLMYMMKKHLNYYYIKMKYKLIILIVVMIQYLTMSLIGFIPLRFFYFQPDFVWFVIHSKPGKII